MGKRKTLTLREEDFKLLSQAKAFYAKYRGRQRITWSQFLHDLAPGLIAILGKEVKKGDG